MKDRHLRTARSIWLIFVVIRNCPDHFYTKENCRGNYAGSLQVCLFWIIINSENPRFSHGQLYVVYSRFRKPDVFLYDPVGETKKKTKLRIRERFDKSN